MNSFILWFAVLSIFITTGFCHFSAHGSHHNQGCSDSAQWGEWNTNCRGDCGRQFQTRTRNCGWWRKETEKRACLISRKCWQPWGCWSACIGECGSEEGVRKRHRISVTPDPHPGNPSVVSATDVEGVEEDSETCLSVHSCKWSSWNEENCANDPMATRSRTCDFTGLCSGPTSETCPLPFIKQDKGFLIISYDAYFIPSITSQGAFGTDPVSSTTQEISTKHLPFTLSYTPRDDQNQEIIVFAVFLKAPRNGKYKISATGEPTLQINAYKGSWDDYNGFDINKWNSNNLTKRKRRVVPDQSNVILTSDDLDLIEDHHYLITVAQDLTQGGSSGSGSGSGYGLQLDADSLDSKEITFTVTGTTVDGENIYIRKRDFFRPENIGEGVIEASSK